VVERPAPAAAELAPAPARDHHRVGLRGELEVEPPVARIAQRRRDRPACAGGIGQRDAAVETGDEVAVDARGGGVGPVAQRVPQVQAVEASRAGGEGYSRVTEVPIRVAKLTQGDRAREKRH